MARHGVRLKPEQIVSVLRQIEVLTANGKGLDEACKTLTIMTCCEFSINVN
jgi:hypothetical protein